MIRAMVLELQMAKYLFFWPNQDRKTPKSWQVSKRFPGLIRPKKSPKVGHRCVNETFFIIDKFCNSNRLCDWSLTSKMTGWGAVMTGQDRSYTSTMTS